jgi:hypothetical protein
MRRHVDQQKHATRLQQLSESSNRKSRVLNMVQHKRYHRRIERSSTNWRAHEIALHTHHMRMPRKPLTRS